MGHVSSGGVRDVTAVVRGVVLGVVGMTRGGDDEVMLTMCEQSAALNRTGGSCVSCGVASAWCRHPCA